MGDAFEAMSTQQELLPLPTAGEPERPAHPSGAPRRPKVKTIDRKQSLLVPLDVEALVAPDHKVRAIWELAGKMNLSRFEEQMGWRGWEWSTTRRCQISGCGIRKR